MADAYQGYNKVNETNRCCCYAHIRRYLLEAIPKGHEKDYTHPAVQGFLYCNKLFEYERTYKEKGLSYKQIENRRLKDQKPVVEGFLAWVNQATPGDNAKLKKAITYIKNRRDFLTAKAVVGNTTKVHAIVDGLGNPVYFQLSSGNINDNTLAVEVLSHVEIKDSNIQGDKAYGTKEIREYIASKEASYTIPPKSNTQNPWECDWWVYKERHLVECFFNKIKHFRRVSTRYDKLATSFLSFFLLCFHI
jgi:transposase